MYFTMHAILVIYVGRGYYYYALINLADFNMFQSDIIPDFAIPVSIRMIEGCVNNEDKHETNSLGCF